MTTMTAPTSKQDAIKRQEAEIVRSLSLLREPGQVVEMRVPKVDGKRTRIDAGYFNDPAKLAAAATRYNKRAAGVYITPNPVNPELLARAANRMAEWSDLASTGDNDISRRRWLLVDLDPVRPAGISSTDEEHAAAIARAHAIWEYLVGQGWTEPLTADSGNGAHLLWRIDLPNDQESADLVQQCLQALAAEFDDTAVKVDTTTFNASRIWKLYGTLAGKGDSTPERPHRWAHILETPATLAPVNVDLLRDLALLAPTENEPKNSYSAGTGQPFDLESFIERHSAKLDPSTPKRLSNGTVRWRINCIQNSDHRGDAVIGQRASGALWAKCSHDSCRGRWGWKDLRALLEPKTIHTNGTGPQPAAADGKKTKTVLGKATEIRQALADLGHSFRLNLLRERLEHPNGDSVHDGEQAAIIAALYDLGLGNKQLMLDVILSEAWAHRYDPLIDFLDGLTWDGEDHISRLSYHFDDRHPLIEYPDETKRTVFEAWLRHWLIGAVGRGMGALVQNPMLVLVGDQGIGKSEFSRWLCSPMPDFFVESAINPELVDHQRWATGNFIWEVGELGATTRKADVEMLKSFLTRHEHSYRVPYARNEVHKRTRVSFIGTINPDNAGFLMDVTGNRRFLTVEITAIDWRGYTTKIDVGQVWAQARALYERDANAWQLEETERAVRDRINGEFGMEDPVRDAILALFDVTPNAEAGVGAFVSNADLVFQVGSHVRHTSARAIQMDIARALKGLGVTKGRCGSVRGYWGIKRQPSANLANLPPTW